MSLCDSVKFLLCAVLITFGGNVAGFVEMGEISQILNEITIDEKLDKWPRKMEKRSHTWRDSNVKYRERNYEELSITNIEVWRDENVRENIHNWQFIEHHNEMFFGGSDESMFYLYHFNSRTRTAYLKATISSSEPIRKFKIISPLTSGTAEINVVLSTAEKNGTNFLRWYHLKNNELILFWIFELEKIVKSMEYFDFNYQDKLLLLYESDTYHGEKFSQVEIYDLKINGSLSEFRLCHQFLSSETSDIKICPPRGENMIISLLSKNHIILYEYKDEDITRCVFQHVQNITIPGVNSALCFDSGNLQYLVTSGLVTNSFKNHWTTFVSDEKMRTVFNEIGNIEHVQYLPVDTYRDEVVLFVQLKNSSVFALGWQESGFEAIPLPNEDLSKLSLSQTSIIPNFGFIYGNLFVNLGAKLKELYWPRGSRIVDLSDYRSELENILKKQEEAVLEMNSLVERDIEQFSQVKDLNFNEIEIGKLTFNKSNDFQITLGSENLTLSEMKSEYEDILDSIDRIESRMNEAEIQKNATPSNISEMFFNEINIKGDLDIQGNLKVESLKVERLNNISMEFLKNECSLSNNATITGTKSFPTINFTEDNLKIRKLNGIPLKDISFDHEDRSYKNINISKINKLEVENSLNFSKINGIDWNDMMENIVLKNEKKSIPGVTMITKNLKAGFLRVDLLNGLEYPSDYVVVSDPKVAEVTSTKTFDILTVYDFSDVKTINDIDADDFIILNADQSLTHQITFENLVIDESLEIDGVVTGIPEQDIDTDLTLLNSNEVQSNVMLKSLRVNGNIFVGNSMNGSQWSEFDDVILEDERSAVITGMKTFLGNVHVRKNLEIKTRIINGHHVRDFVTLDTRQTFHNLTRMSGNVTFENVSYEELKNLEEQINADIDKNGKPKCLRKPLIFAESPIVDEFSAQSINENISGSEFSGKVDFLLKNVYFENLQTDKLIVDDIVPGIVNGIDLEGSWNGIMSKSGYQTLSGNVTIRNLKTGSLYAHFLNNQPAKEIRRRMRKLNSLYEELLSGRKVIDTLSVTGSVIASSINGESLYKSMNLQNISIDNLEVVGLFNGVNISEQILDTVLKSENPVVIKGPKKMRSMRVDNLQTQFINKHSVENIISPDKHQILSGPVKIIGSSYVNGSFSSLGRLNELNLDDFDGKIVDLGNGVVKLKGNFLITNASFIRNLKVDGYLQNKDANAFLEDLVYIDEENVTISGSKIFKSSVRLLNNVTILKNMNEVNLEKFYENAVFIDHPFTIHSAMVFENDILVGGDLVVEENLKAGSLSGIDIDNLMENAVYLNRPTSLIETLTLSNVIFESDITIDSWNGIEMNKLFTLHDDSFIHNSLQCVNASVHDLEIRGLVNGENLTEIYENTFMLSTDQFIMGEACLSNNTRVKGDFNAKQINDVDINNVISLNDEEPMYGDFIFNNSVVMHDDLHLTNESINRINITQWKSSIDYSSTPIKNIISGNWTIDGNVNFKRNAHGPGSINGLKLSDLAEKIEQEKRDVRSFVSEEMRNFKQTCKQLQVLKEQTEKITYKFKAFEYLRVLQFDQRVESIHHFEYEDVDYVAVNFETCHLDVFAYTSEGFVLAANLSDFGLVKEYVPLKYGQDLYFVTVGRAACGRSSGNLWKFRDYQFVHILDLVNVNDATQSNEDAFIVVNNFEVQEWSLQRIAESFFKPVNVVRIVDSNIRFFKNKNDTLLISKESIFKLRGSDRFKNPIGTNNIMNFQVGVFRKEHILRNNDQEIFIYNDDLSQLKVIQTIKGVKIGSIVSLNFDDFLENLLIFSENKRFIQIYEYKGIESFQLRSRIKMRHDKLYSFKLRVHPYFTKKHCLAVVQDKTLTILEAKTFGEKMDMNGQLICSA